jgi:hypothetical protein
MRRFFHPEAAQTGGLCRFKGILPTEEMKNRWLSTKIANDM